jgi:hypothetical protein
MVDMHSSENNLIIDSDGKQKWRQNGRYHRLDGPAIIRPDGTQIWYQNGRYHRLDGPAIIRPDGTQVWLQNDKRHRLDGPAIIRPDGTCEIWVNGEIPSVWNNHIITGDDLPSRFPSAIHKTEYRYDAMSVSDVHVYWIEDKSERTLAILMYC